MCVYTYIYLYMYLDVCIYIYIYIYIHIFTDDVSLEKLCGRRVQYFKKTPAFLQWLRSDLEISGLKLPSGFSVM